MAFLELARQCDVVLENFRPGTLERYDLSPKTLLDANPRLVVLRASGFGQTGPYAPRAAFNPVGLALGGATYLNGWPDRPPLRDGVTAGDYSTALFNALGMLAGLLRRDVDGQGQVIDTGMFEAVLRMTGDLLAARTALGIRRERAGGEGPAAPCAVTAEASDGRYVAVSSDQWEKVAAAVGQPAVSDAAALRQAVADRVRAQPSHEAVRTFRAAGLAASRVNSLADLMNEPHLRARGDLIELTGAELAEIVTLGVIPSLSLTPGRMTSWSTAPGSDNEAILSGILGYSAGHLEELTKPTASNRE
jgi:formyl-CoA transferase